MKKLVLNEVESKILQRDGYVYIVRNGFDILVEGDKDCGYIITSINPYDKVVVKNDESEYISIPSSSSTTSIKVLKLTLK